MDDGFGVDNFVYIVVDVIVIVGGEGVNGIIILILVMGSLESVVGIDKPLLPLG